MKSHQVELEDCKIGDHVLFNTRGRTVDGEIIRIRDSRRGKRFYVQPRADVAFGARAWILGSRVPVLKMKGS